MKKSIVKLVTLLTVITLVITSCSDEVKRNTSENSNNDTITAMEEKVNAFAEFKLTSDVSHLTDNQKEMLPLLFKAAKLMDEIFWMQAYGDKTALMKSLETDAEKAFAEINYGPWERLNGNKAFVDGVGEKPKGAQFYPTDMTEEEFDALESVNKTSLYTLIKRDDDGNLYTEWYHEAYKERTEETADLLKQAGELAESEGFKKYLNLRAEALLSDDYLASDMAWMEMTDNDIDFVVGPIENYEDALYGYKAAHESYVLIKDKKWSKTLQRFAEVLPEMQKQLPVPAKYKQEVPGRDSELAAYDVVFYAGDCNAGSKTIAINLPNDERVHLEKGSRRLQLKNAMKAKFEKILVPISEVLIDESQRKHITFDAFFENTMFHETAHGLGIKETVNGNGSVRNALKDVSTTLEEGKADILGLFFVTKLYEQGEFPEKDLRDNYVTFMASIFRSVRFGVSSSHGKANMLRFYYFKEHGAFVKNPENGTYRINMEKMKEAMTSLSEKILILQGDGNYTDALKWVNEKGKIDGELEKDLNRVNDAGIPVDIIFDQGLDNLEL
ncbi:MAG: Zn-dependent hydrolase [Bacteroidota bacterium]|nr:Zn-dependent hydrolase [Bacteroidota bacterium]